MTEKYYWLNKDSIKFLERGYLLEGETAQQRIRDIANKAEETLKIEGFADKFEDYMSRGFYSLSSPIWANYARTRGLPISCFGSYIDDSIESITGEKLGEISMMTKHGGGTSAYFGAVRPRGAKISSGGESTGAVHFMEVYDTLMNVVSQGNVRRGSFAAYLPFEHPDIEEFLQIKADGNSIQSLSFGVTITDESMKAIRDGDKAKRKIWSQIIKRKFDSGYPYIMFTDTMNNNAPQVYKDKGLKINNSNLCVTGDQRVVSSLGLLTAKELYETQEALTLFDNCEAVKSSAMRLIERDADVYKITLENGMTHSVTAYHKVVTLDKRIQKTGEEQIIVTKDTPCSELKIGDKVAIQTAKGLFGSINKPKEAFLLGLYQADGTQHKDLIMLDLWENDFDLLSEVQEYHDYVCDAYRTQISTYNGRVYDKPKFVDCVVRDASAAKKRLVSKALKKSLNFEKGMYQTGSGQQTKKHNGSIYVGSITQTVVFLNQSLKESLCSCLSHLSIENSYRKFN